MFDGVQFSKEQAGELFGIKNIFTLKERQDDTRTEYRVSLLQGWLQMDCKLTKTYRSSVLSLTGSNGL